MRFRKLALALTSAAVAISATTLTPGRPADAAPRAVVTPGLAEMLEGDLGKVELVAVHFRAGSQAERVLTLKKAGFDVVADMAAIDTVWASGALRGVRTLQQSSLVDHLEENTKLEYFDDTADWATRTRPLQLPVAGGPYRDANGDILDGKGVGLAVVDSGVDGSHPDLKGRIGRHIRLACSIVLTTVDPEHGCFPTQGNVEMPPGTNSDLASGHGTHVVGMAVGDGTASSGFFKGTAPGATLHAFGAGAGLHNFFAASALAYLYDNYNSFTPRIKVINNSYGGADDYDPLSPVTLYTNKLLDEHDVVSVFAAGNDGGDGSEATTSSYCRNPKPGVICAANYDEDNLAKRNNALDASSSRGLATDAAQETWPDLSAPGAFVTSTCARNSAALCNAAGFITPSIYHEPYYGDASGTSMAAPMIAGGVAILRQANPSLTAAQVEDILKDTAHKFPAGSYVTDVDDPARTTSFDKGTGLMDLVAAVSDARIAATADANNASAVTLVSGDGGEPGLLGSADVVSATATPGLTGVTYTVTLRDANDRPPALNPSLRVTQTVNGVTYRSDVSVTVTGATPAVADADAATAEPSSASRSGNVVTFEVPYSKIGNPAAGDPAINTTVNSFIGLIVDTAPSPGVGVGALDLFLRPGGAHYTVR